MSISATAARNASGAAKSARSDALAAMSGVKAGIKRSKARALDAALPFVKRTLEERVSAYRCVERNPEYVR
jgi:hypothetical protein